MGNYLGFSQESCKFKFKKENSFEERHNIFLEFKKSNPNKIPIIIEPGTNVKLNKDIYKLGFKPNLTMSHLTLLLRQKENMNIETACYLKVKAKYLLPGNVELSDAYERYKDKDGFLYFTLEHEMLWG